MPARAPHRLARPSGESRVDAVTGGLSAAAFGCAVEYYAWSVGGEPRGSAAYWLLILPGAVVVYALVGALWHPLLGGQVYGCFEGPWVAVFVGAVVVGFGLLVSGLVLLIARKSRLEGWTAFAGILTIAAGFIVFEVAAANDYNVCSS